MPVKHYVLFKFKNDATGFLSETEKLKEIPGVSNLYFGKNYTERGKGYTHILSLDVPSKTALDAYAVHPIHLEYVATVVKPNVEDVLAMDIEI